MPIYAAKHKKRAEGDSHNHENYRENEIHRTGFYSLMLKPIEKECS